MVGLPLILRRAAPLVRRYPVRYPIRVVQQRQFHLARNPAPTSYAFGSKIQVRPYSGVIARGLGVIIRRAIVYPIAIFTAGGLSIEEMKKRLPEFEVPDFLSKWGVFVSNTLDDLKDTVGNLSDSDEEKHSEGELLRHRFQKERSSSVFAATPNESGDESKQEEAISQPPPEEEEQEDDEETKLRSQVVVLEKQVKELHLKYQQRIARLETRIVELEQTLNTAEAHAQREIFAEREKLQEEINRLSAENQELQRVLIIGSRDAHRRPKRAIDMFSEILEIRNSLDSTFDSHDALPRVVVVGDQSAGKTSVLEVLVRARVFPRGAGEMMTRAPIQVTMSQGEKHEARLKGVSRAFDLKSESDLKDLRDEIEKRMLASLGRGDVVSNNVLAMEIQGPGLQPMVLVDLPGIIQHHTRGMPTTTKEAILGMCQSHINNPNSIILCIQDASRDAEGSSVADVVKTADPEGARTIFVLTKVDLAEKLNVPGPKLRSILNGEKFNMNAKAYFAVVTGTSNPNDSIEEIRQTEREYFAQSELFRQGVFSSRRTGTDHLSRAVSDAFWERVQATVQEESQSVQQMLRDKETEWRNTFPQHTRMSRDDLFGMARHDMLQSLAQYSSKMTPTAWEKLLHEKIWEAIKDELIDQVYLPASAAGNPAAFKTRVDNQLDRWLSSNLPNQVVDAAQEAVLKDFLSVLDKFAQDGEFVPLTEEVKRSCVSDAMWPRQSLDRIRSLQELMLKDDMVKSKEDWNKAAAFMQEYLQNELTESEKTITSFKPNSTLWRWITWTSVDPEKQLTYAAIQELAPYVKGDDVASSQHLSKSDITTLQHSISKKYGKEVSEEHLLSTHHMLYKKEFLTKAVQSAKACRNKFGVNNPDVPNGLACSDVILFWRFANMLDASVSKTRLEAVEYKKDLEASSRDALNEIAASPEAKTRLISGPRVTLAEEIEVLRQLQARFETFHRQLKKEGRVRED